MHRQSQIPNYYERLGLNSNATSDEIRSAYRKLSIKFHPDKNDGDSHLSGMFRQINEAYQILSDTNKRKEYDYLFLKCSQKEVEEADLNDEDIGSSHTNESEASSLEEAIEELLAADKSFQNKSSEINEFKKSNLVRKIGFLKFAILSFILIILFANRPSKSIMRDHNPNSRSQQYESISEQNSQGQSNTQTNKNAIQAVDSNQTRNLQNESEYQYEEGIR
jgi:curved DNA-binding protein